MSIGKIIIKNAKVNNLKGINLEIPRDKLVVLTGLSGSGKSSLAFDTLFAEGQRRYIESLSSYARQFLGQMEKPDVESIDGLSPAISIDQKTTSKNPRSTVGTVTEIHDYLRLLYARIGIPHCPICGHQIVQQTIDQIVDKIAALPESSRIILLAPIVRGRKGEYIKELEQLKKSGYARVRVDGNLFDLSEKIELDKNKKHNIEVVVDRLVIKNGIESRLTDSVETALSLSGGLLIVSVVGDDEILFSQNYSCPEHDISVEELSPRMFSFNNPYGSCPECSGLGVIMTVDPSLVVSDENLSLEQGAIRASGWNSMDKYNSIANMYYQGLGKKYGFTMSTPFKNISDAGKRAILFGTDGEKFAVQRSLAAGGSRYMTDFEGVVNNLSRRYTETTSEYIRNELEEYMSVCQCQKCKGARLNSISLAVTVGDKNIDELSNMSIFDLINFLDHLELNNREQIISAAILKEIKSRLGFLKNVGLDYLCLSRSASTLSGGESQRIRLATQIGSSLIGVMYILDEPSIGLHQRDNERLIDTLKHLRDVGNTVIVVEHDEDTMRASDYIVDIGPEAGVHGGEVVCAGTVDDIIACEKSITGAYLSGKRFIPIPAKRRRGNGNKLILHGCCHNNLKNIDAAFPLGTFVAVTGVSGSGKSSLVNEILYKRLACDLNGAKTRWGKHSDVSGKEFLDKVINIDQSPIGRTPRSNPATYTGVFTDIRELYAQTKEAKMKGYNSGRFSFNIKGGRCEACQGDGIVKIEMHFLPDVYVPCDVCNGHRYNRETLEIKYKGKNIFDVLDMTVEDAISFFENVPKIYNKIKTLYDVGLGYIKLGQPATTLSGGEAQRVKLATELLKRSTGSTIYVLDEPTTGLHTADVHRLIEVLNKLVDAGNTVVVIEHNLDVIKIADHIIDLGPEGGSGGGYIIAEGTPEAIAACDKSYTGKYLRKVLSK